MSEAQLYRLQTELRLLARRDCRLDRTGHLLGGRIRPMLERARAEVSSIIDQVMDGRPLCQPQISWLKRLERRLGTLRPITRAIERELESEMQLELRYL